MGSSRSKYLFLRRGWWWGILQLKARGTDKRRKRRQVRLARHKDVAEKLLRVQQSEIDLGKYVDPKPKDVGVGDLVKDYLTALERRASPAHVENTRRSLRMVLELTGAKFASDIGARTLQSIEKALTEKGRSTRTINIRIGAWVNAVRWALANGMIDTDLTAGWKKLPEGGRFAKKRRYRLTEADCVSLLAAARTFDSKRAKGIPQAPLVELLLQTGFRFGEAASLRWMDWTATRAVVAAGQKPTVTNWLTVGRATPTKNGTERSVPIPLSLCKSLKSLRAIQGQYLGHIAQGTDHILLSPMGEPLTNAHARRNRLRWLRGILVDAGLADWTIPPEPPKTDENAPGTKRRRSKTKAAPKNRAIHRKDGLSIDLHTLRHTYCTMLRERGVPLDVAADLMGHKTLRMTRDIYTENGRVPRAFVANLLPAYETPASDRSETNA